MHPALARLRSMWRWFAGGAVLLLIYTLAGFFLVPRLARGAAEDFITQRLERQVTIGKIEFNPFTFAARVTDFHLSETDGRPLVGFDELLVNVQLSSLWNRALTFAEIRLAGPDVNAVIGTNGALNLAALVPPSAAPDEDQEPASLPAVRIGLLEVLTGRIALEDQSRRTPFRAVVQPIQFTLNDFRTAVDYQNAYRFAGTTQAGEQLEWSGQFSVQPLGSKGNFSITRLKAATLWAYVRDQVAFTLPSGQIDLGGNYTLAVNNANQIELGLALPQIRLSDFTIAPQQPEGSAPWITIPELVLTDTSFALTERRLAIQKIALNGAQADVWLEKDGTINLTRFAGEATASPAPEDSPAPTPTVATTTPVTVAPAWRAEVASFEIRDAAIKASDRSIEPAVEMSFAPVSLTLTGLDSDLTRPFDVNADIGINQSGRLLAQGKLRPMSLLADMEVELKDFGLPVLQPYVSQVTAMTLGSGRFNIKGHVTYAAEPVPKQPQLTFTGGIDVNDFASKDEFLKEDFLKWKLLSLTGIDYTFGPDRLTIERILAREPYARVIISPDAKLNVTQVLNPGAADVNPDSGPEPKAQSPKPASSGPQPVAAPASTPMPMRINTVVVENGSANFADFSINPSFATGIQSLAGTVRGLSSNPGSRAKVDLKGSVDRFSPVVIAGEVNLLSAALYTDIAMSFSNMELTTFNPYSGKFAGYNIAKGKLTTELKYKVSNRALEAEHHVVLDQLEFGAATDSKDAVPLPIKLAVSLLKDRNGVIDISLPVRGTLDDPSFRLGPIIWKAVIGLLTKIVTAPFALLGSLFGGGEDLAFIDFPAGSAQLTAESAGKLTTLSKALVERPQLKLDIPLNVTTALDAEAMAREALKENVPVVAEEIAADDPAALQQRLQTLVQAHTRIVGTAPVLPAAEAPAPPTAAPTPDGLRAQIDFVEKALLAHYAPTDPQLQTLARGRADAVQGALLGSGEIAAERVFLTTRELGTQAGGNVRMELKLE